MDANAAQIAGPGGQYLQIEPVRYQFEDLERQKAEVERRNAQILQRYGRYVLSKDDANWLMVRIAASDGRREWEAVDPAFRVQDLQRLVEWLRSLAAATRMEISKFRGIEPCLRLEAQRSGESVVLQALFESECHPSRRHSSGDPYVVEMIATPGALRRFADALEEKLRPFPIRELP